MPGEVRVRANRVNQELILSPFAGFSRFPFAASRFNLIGRITFTFVPCVFHFERNEGNLHRQWSEMVFNKIGRYVLCNFIRKKEITISN